MSPQKPVLTLVTLVTISMSISTQAIEDSEDKYKPSSNVAFDASKYQTFDDYVKDTTANVIKNKIYLDKEHQPAELVTSLPYELTAYDCPGPKKGIVLIHGLSDTAYAMKDLAFEFSSRCFSVRTVLLPGHGTRAGDLLNVKREDWVNLVKFSVNTFKDSVDDVYVGGYSLGGLLALDAAADDEDIKAVFAFSPAIEVKNSVLVWNAKWIKYIADWADTGDRDDLTRYEAMPFQAAAETYDLTDDLQDKLEDVGLDTPVFIAQSSDDETVDSDKNKQYFVKTMTNTNNILISYNSKKIVDKDKRIKNIDVRDYENRIVSFSHQSVHIAPENSYYGKEGVYRNCGINATDRTKEELNECYTTDRPWMGEVKDYPSNVPFNPRTMGRLTYNPQFDDMMKEIDLFLKRI